MRLKAPKRGSRSDFYLKVGDDYLSVGFVPLCASKRPLTVKCPMCGIVMKSFKEKSVNKIIYFCPECGIRG